MPDRYPGYDVLAKRDSPSWNEQTRRAIDERLALDSERHAFFSDAEWPTVRAICARVLAQEHGDAARVPLAAMLDQKLAEDSRDGYRDARLPAQRDAWRRALLAFDAEAVVRHGRRFHELALTEQADLLSLCQQGELRDPAWGEMPPAEFFSKRLLHDVVGSYYAHPIGWNEIGYGGPASPRGYVRMNYDRRDPWEASEARPGREGQAYRENLRLVEAAAKRLRGGSSRAHGRHGPEDAAMTPRAIGGRAPDVFQHGGWVPMREYSRDEPVDFAIVGTGAGGGTLACRLAEHGFSVVAFDAGPYWRPLEDFASDEHHQQKLYWTDERIVDGENPLQLGANNCGKSVGGSTVHFAMVSLRFRPEWFKSRTLLGYGVDWPLDWREMWSYYREVENALKISGPVRYPWGPKRPRYPYRPHELNAAALALAESAEALGIDWAPTPLATLSAPRGRAHPCVYRGMCVIGCSTNAKQSVLVTWLPRALAAGAEIRDLAMVGRIEHDAGGRATGVRYQRQGRWQFQRARNVVVAGYAIETPRLLLNSASGRYPHGLANSSGLVGRNLMVQANQAVWGLLEREVRSYKGPPSLAITEHWNYTDRGKDFFGGYSYMSQGPLPMLWSRVNASKRGLWGARLRAQMEDYNHQVGLKIVGECMPQERNGVSLAEERDQYGIPVPRVTYSYCDNDQRLIRHALGFLREAMATLDARDIWEESDDTCHLNGTARMGDDPRTSVVNADCRSWDIPNLWICDGSVFPTVGGVNPSLTIQAIACRTADRIKALAARGEL
ncbi:MAG TPA: GMC family oxidoreductase [Steroidobacteraceae bacterium]|nr:GMC family oxidoreductase [Steroidobacteraceae bacterium]